MVSKSKRTLTKPIQSESDQISQNGESMSRLLKSAAACLIFSSMAFAQNTADESAKKKDAPKMLSVGDKAPAINDIDWVKGKGIEAFAPGESYVVECWATWCGPCIRASPMLAQMQQSLGDDLQIVGVTGIRDPRSDVEKFIEKNGEKYAHAYDTDATMLRQIGIAGIPHVLIMSTDGVIRWQGNPLED